jgi:hypothetical protein
MANEIKIVELEGSSRVDRESGSLIVYRKFAVHRPGHDEHIVRVEMSESGAPQSERCDCKAFRFRGECGHVDAVLDCAKFPVYED